MYADDTSTSSPLDFIPDIIKIVNSDFHSQGGHSNILYTRESIHEFQSSPKSINKTCTHPKISNRLLDEIHLKLHY